MDHTIPVISMRSAECAATFTDSLRRFGFAALSDHPLDMNRVNSIYEEWRTFFKTEEKFAYAFDAAHQDGYFGLQDAESAKGFVEQDFKEYFHYYPWGRCPSHLLDNVKAYYEESQTLAAQLLIWVEQHSPAQVKARYSQPLSTMIDGSVASLLRILHYPPQKGDSKAPRANAHEDINLLTILPAADGPGLLVKHRDGQWITVPNEPGTVIINTGDMLQEVSGGYFPSTTHQVAAGSGSLNESRMSMPLFLHPKAEVKLSGRYTAGSYLRERLQELGVLKA